MIAIEPCNRSPLSADGHAQVRSPVQSSLFDSSTMTDINSPEVTNTDAPSNQLSFSLSARGFKDEQNARNIAHTVGACINALSSHFDLSGLDGVTVAHDYAQALLDLDRGYVSARQLTPTTGQTVGVAMTPSVLRAGTLKSHIVFNARFVEAIKDGEHEAFPFALHLIVHECAHVEITSKFDSAFPGVLLRKNYADLRIHYRWDCILGCWDEYAATRWSAGLGYDPTDAYEETFIKYLTQTRDAANERIKAYRIHGDVDKALSEVYGTYGQLLKYAAYHVGNLDGQGVAPQDRPIAAKALEEHWFAPYFEKLHVRCRAIADEYGKWEHTQSFELLGDLLEEVLADGGLHFAYTPNGQLLVKFPFGVETMPVS